MSEFHGPPGNAPRTPAEPRGAPADDFVAIAEIARPHGVRGEVKARLLCSEADYLARCAETGRLLLARRVAEGEPRPEARPVAIEIAHAHGEFAVLRIEGVGSRDEAGALRGSRIGLREKDLPGLPAGDYYRFELEGMEVVDAAGKRIGHVERIEENPAHDQIVVAPDEPTLRPFMIPMVEAFVPEIDLGANRIRVELPKGLIESQQ